MGRQIVLARFIGMALPVKQAQVYKPVESHEVEAMGRGADYYRIYDGVTQNQWNSGKCDICDRSCGECCFPFCCTPCAVGNITELMESADGFCCYGGYWTSCCLTCCCCLLSGGGLLGGGGVTFITCPIRGAIRHKYDIPGNLFEDCCSTCCCSFLSTAQELKELRLRFYAKKLANGEVSVAPSVGMLQQAQPIQPVQQAMPVQQAQLVQPIQQAMPVPPGQKENQALTSAAKRSTYAAGNGPN